MLSQPPIWLIVIAFLAAIGPLVIIHELGHYWVARLFGVRSESFSVGFGREIAGWTDKRGTRWKIGWLPLGGYVKFAGDENAASVPARTGPGTETDPGSFHTKPVWQRFLIVLAGPMANFILAIAIFVGFFAITGIPRTANVVTAVQVGSPAQSAGIRAGDRIVSVAGRDTPSFEDIFQIVILRPDERVSVTVDRGGRRFVLPVTIGATQQQDRFGQSFRIGRIGVYGEQVQFVRPGPLELIPDAIVYTWKTTRSMVDGLWQIISGRRSIEDLGGPVKMAQIAGQQASLGLFEFIQLIALFSINLGFINLLPVPMLDGGHLLFYSIEAIRKRPLSMQAQEWAFRGGLALLLALILFTTINDLGSVGLWDSVGRLIG